MFGRGYVNEGLSRSAFYISSYFRDLDLSSYSSLYFQEFGYPVNTFPQYIDAGIDGKRKKNGESFLIHPASGPGYGRCKLTQAPTTKEDLMSLAATEISEKKRIKECYWLDAKEHKEVIDNWLPMLASKAPVMIRTLDKFTWWVSPNQFKHPVIYFQQSKPFTDESKAFYSVESHRFESFFTKNVIGYVPGTKEPEKFLLLTAHYDHLGGMGNEVYIPGANDNASGTAMMMSLAKYFKENPLPYSVVFIAFSGEEAGLHGSKYFVENSPIPLEQIQCVFNIDLMGSGQDGATVVNATEFPTLFQKLEQVNNNGKFLPQIKKRGKAANSDHYWFSEKGVPAFFMYLMGDYTHYHDINDKPENLPLTHFEPTKQLIIEYFKALSNE